MGHLEMSNLIQSVEPLQDTTVEPLQDTTVEPLQDTTEKPPYKDEPIDFPMHFYLYIVETSIYIYIIA